ncbi:MAG: glycosyltransferase family 39 protein [Anaerolineae bacterium]|nr:glycosyltransferase family 39 protein [Anaerolineae bacterium]
MTQRARFFALALTTVGLGVAARLAQYASCRSIWLDEAYLALNILQRDFVGLLSPLDDNQIAPPLFLWAVKGVSLFLGTDELALRLVPLLGGVLAVPLLYRLARRVTGPVGVLMATALFGWAQPLFYYSSELKPYATDALAAILALTVGLPLLEESSHRRWTLLAAGLGIILPWFSYPSAFALGGLGMALLTDALVRRDGLRARRAAALLALWGASGLLLYATVLRPGLGNPFLKEFWREFFAPFPPRSLSDLYWFAQMWFDFLVFSAGLPFYGLATFAWLTGVLLLWREGRRPLVLALVLPFIGAVVASGLKLYPLYIRILLFAVPPTVLLMAAGAEALYRLLAANWRAVAVAWVVLLLFHPLYRALSVLGTPLTNEEMRPVLEQVRESWQSGDYVYVYHAAAPVFAYYAPRFGLDDPAVYRVGRTANGDFRVLEEDVARLPEGRVWFLFAHIYTFGGISEQSFLLAQADGRGTRLLTLTAPNASAVLYQFRGHP